MCVAVDGRLFEDDLRLAREMSVVPIYRKVQALNRETVVEPFYLCHHVYRVFSIVSICNGKVTILIGYVAAVHGVGWDYVAFGAGPSRVQRPPSSKLTILDEMCGEAAGTWSSVLASGTT